MLKYQKTITDCPRSVLEEVKYSSPATYVQWKNHKKGYLSGKEFFIDILKDH